MRDTPIKSSIDAVSARRKSRQTDHPGPPAYKKGEVTAERILDAAFKAIATHGCSAVNLRGIAEDAGVALSQLNYYYGDKKSMFVAVLKEIQNIYRVGLEDCLACYDSWDGKISGVIDYHEIILQERPEIYQIFLAFSTFTMSTKDFRPPVAVFTAENAEMIATHLAPYNRQVGRDDFSDAEVVRYLLSASFGIAIQHFLSPEIRDIRRGFELIRETVRKLFH